MAKKTVASLQTDTKRITKIIKCVKKEKTGAYSFKEEYVDLSKIKDSTNNVV